MSSKNSKAVAEAAETISANCLAARIRLLHRTITGIFQRFPAFAEGLGRHGATTVPSASGTWQGERVRK